MTKKACSKWSGIGRTLGFIEEDLDSIVRELGKLGRRTTIQPCWWGGWTGHHPSTASHQSNNYHQLYVKWAMRDWVWTWMRSTVSLLLKFIEFWEVNILLYWRISDQFDFPVDIDHCAIYCVCSVLLILIHFKDVVLYLLAKRYNTLK